MSEAVFQEALRRHQAGKFAESRALYEQVLRSDPRHFQALYLLGFVHFQLEEFETAERLIGEATVLNPQAPDAFYNRGCALQKLKRDEDAVAAFNRALRLNPRYTDALFNRATSFLRLHRYDEALADLDKTLRVTPNDPQSWHNRADALVGLRRFPEAIKNYSHALTLGQDAKTLSKRADTLQILKLYDEAAADYERVLRLDPDFEYARGNLMYCRLHCCDWRDLDANRDAIASAIAAGKNVISPLSHMLFSHSGEEQRRCSELWAAMQYPEAAQPMWRGERYAHDKIRIAYLSANFRTHAVALLLTGVIEHHDRDRFEITGISFGADDTSAPRTRLKKAFDHFIDADRQSDAEIAAFLRRQEIDIAVDLMGFTGECRTGVFAHRPVPLQVNWLGFPGTMGAGYIDYILADSIVAPDDRRGFYSEKVVHLPNTFQPNDSGRRMMAARPNRPQEGLPEDAFVFCSFNNSSKILPETFALWIRILRQVDNSVLWLPEYNPAEPLHLRREAQARGVAPERIVFAKLVATPEEYLARLPLADLFLDTLPYNAHTTASDALWMGVPLLTLIGASFAGRVAASLLHAIGAPEMIAESEADFEAAAVRLARDPGALGAIRKKLKENRDTCPLFDTKRFCRNLESAYAAMHDRHRRGEAPAPFAVEDSAP